MYEYPYLNQSLANMSGEVWKPFPLYDTCLISNYGRVKSLVCKKEKIIRQRVYQRGEIPILSFRVYVDCVDKEFTTAYAVYTTFIEDLDFERYKIIPKDGDGFNLRPSNLQAVKRHKYVMQEKRIQKQKQIALTATMYKHPYQNLSLVDMDGEEWKSLPDLSDYYMVSNKGRIKSLERVFENRGNLTRIKERILKQRVQINTNPYTKEEYHHLSICTRIHEVKREFTVSRLVYEAFVGSIDPHANLRVRHKDRNHCNNVPENLYLSDISEMQYNLLKTGQRPRLCGCSNLEKWTPEEWYSFYDRTRKPVSQFDLEGNFIKTYESITDATNSIGIKQSSSISAAIHGRVHTVGGFQWRSGIDQSPMLPAKPIKAYQKKAFQPKKCAQYDLQGHLLAVYPSIAAAAKENNLKINYLYSLLNNPDRIPRGGKKFIWKSFREDEDVPMKQSLTVSSSN
ncbi:HNH endonuclease [Bacteroides sp. OttesenSCG-928-D19]|nr:HNH endonuclease [Bacteroides sp. OttesenSCG-928-D19]